MSEPIEETVEVVETAETEAPTPERFEDMTDEQLDAHLAAVSEGLDGEDNMHAPVTVGEEDAEEGTETVEEEAEAEAPAAEGDEEAPAEEAASDDDAAEPSEMAQALDRLAVLEAENEVLSASLERETLLRDRNAGKLGALMQKLEKSQDREAAGDFDNDGDAASGDAPKSEVEQAALELRQDRTNQAMQAAGQEFYRENLPFFETLQAEAGDDVATKFQADLIDKLRNSKTQIGEDLSDMSPKMAAKISTTLMKSAFAELKAELLRDVRKTARAKAADSVAKVQARKKGAAGVRSTKKAAVAQVKTKSLSQMTDAELEVELQRVSDQL